MQEIRRVLNQVCGVPTRGDIYDNTVKFKNSNVGWYFHQELGPWPLQVFQNHTVLDPNY